MAYSFRLNDLCDDYFQKNSESIRIVLPSGLGNVDTSRKRISEEISVAKEAIRPNEGFNLETNSMFSEPEMNICIGLNGSCYRHDRITNIGEHCYQRTLLIEYRNRSEKLFKMGKGISVEGIMITIKGNFLKENFFCHLKDEKRREIEENCKNSVPTLFNSSLMSRKTFSLAKDIYNSPFSGVLNNIYLQAKVYEIIYDEFTSIISKRNSIEPDNKVALSQDDMNALHRAKGIILENKRSLGISELSKRVAINEKKLNQGFKKLFGTTPGNMMLETKMYEAKRLLEESEYNVNEVADLTGYRYVQNFTNAFIKFFGEKPSDVMKSKNYYY